MTVFTASLLLGNIRGLQSPGGHHYPGSRQPLPTPGCGQQSEWCYDASRLVISLLLTNITIRSPGVSFTPWQHIEYILILDRTRQIAPNDRPGVILLSLLWACASIWCIVR
jgi:hypothetical protein